MNFDLAGKFATLIYKPGQLDDGARAGTEQRRDAWPGLAWHLGRAPLHQKRCGKLSSLHEINTKTRTSLTSGAMLSVRTKPPWGE
jgi:hypothetical protein